MSGKATILIVFCFLLILSTSYASNTNERKFGYTYQSSIMGKGQKEIEIWTTARLGKGSGYFARLDHRMEFEVCLSKKLQTAFYINFSNTTIDNNGAKSTSFDFKGISTEWKYQISNPSTDAIGFALYTELGLNTDEAELETKLIFDKKVGKTTLALNLTAEPEWELGNGPAETELKLEGTFGLSHAFTNKFSAGFELRNHNVYSEGKLEHSAFFGGPTLSYSDPSWWVTLSVMPQITAFKKTPGTNLDLNEYEKLETRLLFSFRL
jgi:hypothetical protein